MPETLECLALVPGVSMQAFLREGLDNFRLLQFKKRNTSAWFEEEGIAVAIMYPQDLSGCEGASEGERLVYSFLKDTAKPHRDLFCWYRPEIQRNEPDFIVFCRRHGLIVIEIKDWEIDQIKKADPLSFTLFISGNYEKRSNPLKQAKGYVHALLNALKKAQCFESDDPSHPGKVKVPIGLLVAFPNINKNEYCERGFDGPIPLKYALFKDDFDPVGEIWRDTSGTKFHEKVCGAFPFRFEGLTESETGKLKALIWPEIRIDLPERKGMAKDRFEIEVCALDETQARVALRLKSGHQIIKGPPGCGKTLVLVNRCCQLRRYSAPGKRILLVCFNIVLKNYLVRLIQEKGLGVGEEDVQVHHFFELCSRILDEELEYEKKETEYYDSVVELALEALRTKDHSVAPFEAILVDEGQDLSDGMFKILTGLLKPDGDLVIALDDFQNLYRRTMSWKSLGVEAQGRSRSLRRVYRNTAEIRDFARRFIGEEPEEKEPSLFPDGMDFHGESPQLIRFKDQGEVEAFLVKDIKHWLPTKEYKRSEIGILYDDKAYGSISFGYADRESPRRLLKKLESGGMPTTWVSRDVRAKEMFDITTDRVSLISIHSAKGLDFDLVYLMGVDRIQPKDETRDYLIHLLYVAITRAKHRLVIPYVEESEFILRMRTCLYKLDEIDTLVGTGQIDRSLR